MKRNRFANRQNNAIRREKTPTEQAAPVVNVDNAIENDTGRLIANKAKNITNITIPKTMLIFPPYPLILCWTRSTI